MCWEGREELEDLKGGKERATEGEGQRQTLVLLSLLRISRLGLLGSLLLPSPLLNLPVFVWVKHKITCFSAFLHILKAKLGFNDQFSLPWYFLLSKGVFF